MRSGDPYIAVVDDDAAVRTALGRLLRLADYRVATFGCAAEFLASLGRELPACVILDVQMPGLSGLEVQSRMRAMHIDVPVVFITAGDDLGLSQTVQNAGGVTLLRKPFPNDALLNAIGVALRSSPSNSS